MQILLPVFVIGMMGFYSLSGKRRRYFAFCYCVILAIVAWTFQPHVSDDLYREFQNLRGIQQQGWSYFGVKSNQYFSSTKFEGLYLTQLYYYILSFFPSVHFLPAVTTFIVYTLQFSIIEKLAKRYNLRQIEIFALYAFVLCTRETYMIMSGIRNQLAYTIAGYCLYIDLIEKRSRIKCFIVYFSLIFMHQSAVFLLAFRMLCIVRSRKLRYSLSALMLLWSTLLAWINYILGKLPQIPIVNSLLYKINIYTVNNGGNQNNLILTPRYLIYMLSWIPVMMVVLILIYIYKRENTFKVNLENRRSTSFWRKLSKGKLQIRSYASEPSIMDCYDVSWFLVFNVCFTLGSYMYYWLYLRAAIELGVLGFVPLAMLFYSRRQKERGKGSKNIIIGVLFLVLIKLLIIMFYMNRNMDFSFF